MLSFGSAQVPDEIQTQNRIILPEEVSPEDLGRVSFAYFAHTFLGFEIGKHHREWSDALSLYDRLCCIAPRDHGKSEFFSVGLPIWALHYGITDQIYIMSHTQDQASKLMARCIAKIQESPALSYMIPERRKGAWNSSEVTLENGTILARGFGVATRGAHPGIIVVDDPLGDDQIYSPTERAKAIDYFFSAVTNMVVPGGKILVAGTPFHEEDLVYGELRTNEAYHTIIRPAIREELDHTTGKLVKKALWPWRYPIKLLMQRKEEIGGMRFSREFMCKPMSSEGTLFPPELVARCFEADATLVPAYRGQGTVCIGCDFAFSAERRADWTVFTTVLFDGHGNMWIIDIFRDQGMGFRQQVEKIKELGSRYGADVINIEVNGAQRVFFDELKTTTNLPVREYTTGRQKSLDGGVPSLRIMMENGKLRIPRGDQDSRERTDILIDELSNFGWDKGKLQGVGAKDDCVMSLWLAKEGYENSPFYMEFV